MTGPRERALAGAVVLGLVLAAGAAAPLVGGSRAWAADDSAAEALKFAHSRYDEGAYAAAVEAAEAVLEDAPGNEEGLELLVSALAATGDDDAAEKALRRVLAAAPSASAAVVLLGERLAARGAAEEALAALEGASTLPGADRFRPRAARAAALIALDRDDEAAQEIRKLFVAYQAADDDALSAGELRTLARASLLAAEVPALRREHIRSFAEDARDFYQRAWKKGGDADLLAEWARVYADKWDLVEARRLARKALERNPRHAGANALLAEIGLADFFGGTEKYEKARAALDAALAVNPRLAIGHVLRAELYVTDALYEEALAELDAALAARPRDLRALAMKAGILLVRDDVAGAGAIEKTALARGRRAGSELYARMSEFLDGKFRYRDADRYAKKALDIDAESAYALGRAGLAAMRAGDEAAARAALEKAHEVDPFDLFTFNQLKLLDYLDREFVTTGTANFTIRLHKDEEAALGPYLCELAERCWAELSARYGVKLDSPILLEVFPNLNDFSVRAVAHRFIPASGVTFARVVGLASPAAFPPGSHGWGRVLWHELAHVATLERSGYRVPRWLTEGVSVYEESKGHKAWIREWDLALVDALDRGRLLPILELNQGFSKPRFPGQVMLSYYQGGLICQFVAETTGFGAILKLLDGYREGLPLRENLARAAGGITPEEFDRRFLAFARTSLGEIPYRAECEEPQVLAGFRKAAKERPKDRDALARYALAATDMGKFADAETAAAQLRALDPQSGDARLVLAMIANHRGAHDDVPRLAAEARALGTRDPLLAEVLRFRYYVAKPKGSKARRDLKQAIAALESARALFPRHVIYATQLAALYKEAKDEPKRRAALQAVAELLPNRVQERAELAELAGKEGDHATAARWLEEMLWLDPRAPGLHAKLATAWRAIGNVAGADREAALVARLRAAGAPEAPPDAPPAPEVPGEPAPPEPPAPPPVPPKPPQEDPEGEGSQREF